MEMLHDRLAELADDAPTGGAPPADLWARGKRAQYRRSSALASIVLVVVAIGGRLGVSLPDAEPDVILAPGGGSGITLPIEYPVGEELPDLGPTPGPLAAVWLDPREAYTLADDDAGLAPEAVGLVAETGTFGTLPIDLFAGVYEAPSAELALSPDGRRIAYVTATDGPGSADDETELVVWDLVSGDRYSPAFEFEARSGATWVDATHLIGHIAGGSDADGWVWDVREPATSAKLVNPYPYLENPAIYPPFHVLESDPPWSCSSPTIREIIGERTGRSAKSVLCDVRAIIDSEILLGHLNSGGPRVTNDLNRAVVALDIGDGADFPFDDPELRRVVVRPGAPYPVSFATDLIADALESDGGAS